MSSSFRVEPLAPAHRRDLFDCGSPPLDRYIREQATQDIRRRVSNCFVVASDDGVITAYYTFAATSVLFEDMPSDISKRLPRYPLVPGALIGRLAVDQRSQGEGLGVGMLIDAAFRAHDADPAVHSLVVEAKDQNAARFYQTFGFRTFASSNHRLFLPVATAIAAFHASHPPRSAS